MALPNTYTVTNTLSNCTNSNNATSVEEGGSYSATITADTGFYADDTDITVTMGGTNVTSAVLSNGVITIDSVTGNIVITATATDALYPLKNGSFTFSNGTKVTVTNHNHVEIEHPVNQKGWVDFSDLSENTSRWDTADNVKNHTAKFTIPANSTAVLTIFNFTKTVTAGDGACAFNAYGTGTSNLGMDIANLKASTGSSTITPSSDTALGCLFAVPTFPGSYSFDVSFTVDGVKYV